MEIVRLKGCAIVKTKVYQRLVDDLIGAESVSTLTVPIRLNVLNNTLHNFRISEILTCISIRTRTNNYLCCTLI